MKIEKFKVLLYLKKSGMDKNGKAPIMGRITVNRTMAQFSCKLSCTPSALESSCQPIGGQEQGSRGNQQGHRAVVAFHPKGFRCACGKENGLRG